MGTRVRLVHSVEKSRLEEALRAGLRAVSEFPDVELDMRRGVVYCWLSQEDDKLSGRGSQGDRVYLEVEVDRERCTVADMDLISLAMMYQQGSGGKPRNPEASRLLAEVYRITAVPLPEYRAGLFLTPEVLVAGDIGPECIRLGGSGPA